MPKASVKVMRSYDYCHFEVCLSTDQDITLKEVDDMRKEAARLVDKAVNQFAIAKEKASMKFNRECEKRALIQEVENIRKKPEGEWDATEKAKVKALEDHEYWSEHNYNYEDDGEIF